MTMMQLERQVVLLEQEIHQSLTGHFAGPEISEPSIRREALIQQADARFLMISVCQTSDYRQRTGYFRRIVSS